MLANELNSNLIKTRIPGPSDASSALRDRRKCTANARQADNAITSPGAVECLDLSDSGSPCDLFGDVVRSTSVVNFCATDADGVRVPDRPVERMQMPRVCVCVRSVFSRFPRLMHTEQLKRTTNNRRKGQGEVFASILQFPRRFAFSSNGNCVLTTPLRARINSFR